MAKTVLLVDDSGTMRNILAQALSFSGMELVKLEAEDGEKALELFKTNSIDLVITDINMPKMDGLTLIAEIRKLSKTIPILVLTTESKDTLKQQALYMGATGWIVKPFKPAQIISLLKETLNQNKVS